MGRAGNIDGREVMLMGRVVLCRSIRLRGVGRIERMMADCSIVRGFFNGVVSENLFFSLRIFSGLNHVMVAS